MSDGSDSEPVRKRKGDKRGRTRCKRRYVARFGRESAKFRGVILNLSKGGLFIASTNVLRPGTQLLLDFEVEGIQFTLEGVVRWARRSPIGLIRQIPSGMGIEILSPPNEYVELVRKLEERSPRKHVR